MTNSNYFFAILKDDTIKRVVLNQDVINEVKGIFESAKSDLMPSDIDEIEFDGAFNVQDDEILYVALAIPDSINSAVDTPSSIHPYDIGRDEAKGFFWGHKKADGTKEIYLQNFDNRKLLNNKKVLVYSSNTYSKLVDNAFILDNRLCAIFKEGKLYFKSYHNAKRLFDLSEFYTEATNDDIDEFVNSGCVSIDTDWLKDNSNTTIRKQITLALKNEILKNTTASQIQSKANGFLPFRLTAKNRKIDIPEDKKNCRLFLEFLNEQIYKGIFSGKVKRSNSSMDL